MKRIQLLTMGLLMGVLHVACGKARPVVDPACGAWKDDFANRVAGACGECHSDEKKSGSYSVAAYASFLGNGSDDVPNAIAGDASSTVLTVLSGADAKPYHQGFGSIAADLSTWVVECDMRYTRSSIHGAGLMDPARDDFHGQAILDIRGDTSTCERCHGGDLEGGKSGVTCLSCHSKGPKDCSTCHGVPPAGRHPASRKCEDCHAEVIASFGDGNPSQVAWKNQTLHINGNVDMAVGKPVTCYSCHGDAAKKSIAPPMGTHGETTTDKPAVGSHGQHLGAADWHRQISCSDCHATPSSMGHSNGKVDLVFGELATTGGAVATFDGATHSCKNTYCHGATLLPARVSGSVNREPVWMRVDGTFDACGTSCHTNPPGGTHSKSTNCQACHGTSIDSYKAGTPCTATWTDASLHINGTVDL